MNAGLIRDSQENENKNLNKISAYLIPTIVILCLLSFLNSSAALGLGLLIGFFLGNPYQDRTRIWTKYLLGFSIIGLGAGMNLSAFSSIGPSNFIYLFFGIILTLLAGLILGKFLKIKSNTSLLISVGTAICGGSAIAATSIVVKANNEEISVSLGIVFILNAIGLFLFPYLGKYFLLEQHQFGMWIALAIHDTSSVVGAGLQYGEEALRVGTVLKLARASLIVPTVFLIGLGLHHLDSKRSQSKIEVPWFILGFIIAAALVTYFPSLQPMSKIIEIGAKKILVVTIFLMGVSLNRKIIMSVGIRPMIQGVLLWIITSSATLYFIIKVQLKERNEY